MELLDSTTASPAIRARMATTSSPGGAIPGFLAIPAGVTWKSAAVVVGETGALDESTREVCRSLARAGHGALGVDLSSSTLFAGRPPPK
jgi:dienelactone hydrolase